MERRRLSELLTEPPNSMPMPQRSVGFNICKAMGGRPQGPQLCRENHSGGWASLRVQWVPGPFVQMLQPAHPPTELSLPTRYHRWSEANTKSLAPKEPHAGWGAPSWQAEPPSRPRELSPGKCAAGRLRAQVLGQACTVLAPELPFMCVLGQVTHHIPLPCLKAVLRDQ